MKIDLITDLKCSVKQAKRMVVERGFGSAPQKHTEQKKISFATKLKMAEAITSFLNEHEFFVNEPPTFDNHNSGQFIIGARIDSYEIAERLSFLRQRREIFPRQWTDFQNGNSPAPQIIFGIDDFGRIKLRLETYPQYGKTVILCDLLTEDRLVSRLTELQNQGITLYAPQF